MPTDVSSRAKASDKARVAEGKVLLAPLLDEVAKLHATAAARATARENAKKDAAPVAPRHSPPTGPCRMARSIGPRAVEGRR